MSNRDSSLESEYSSEGEYSSEDELPRPNRWNGPASTWLTLTEQERGLAASLDELRNRDLSIHLFNAHALKRRARDLISGVQRPADIVLPHSAVEDDGAFIPPKTWTAWPLLPDEVPREGETVGPEDPDDAFTFRARKCTIPSRPLEECLLAVTLRFAKEQFEAREWTDIESIGEEGKASQLSDVSIDSDSESSLEAHDGASRQSDDDNDNDDDDDDEKGGSPVKIKSRRSESTSQLSPSDRESASARTKAETHKPLRVPEYMRPVVSADDEQSFQLLHPLIHRILFKLDETLTALHHARQTCFQIECPSESSIDDTDAATDPEPPKRPRGRPRKYQNLREPSEAAGSEVDDLRSISISPPRKSRRGRPKKIYERLVGESEQDYLVRVARMQKKALPVFAPPKETQTPEPSRGSESSQQPRPSQQSGRGKGGTSAKSRATSEEIRARRRTELRLRDWSNVVGMAAIVGFSPEVIARATQRCANLFNESMIMNTMLEAPFHAKDADYATLYQPEPIPAFDLDSTDLSEASDIANHPPDANNQNAKARKATRRAPEDRAHLHSWFCPISGCEMQTRGLRYISHLKRHLKTVHKLSDSEVDAYFPNSDEEMDGAVHVDGFLKPIRRKRGERGKDIVQRKRRGLKSAANRSASVEGDHESGLDGEGSEQVSHEDVELASRVPSSFSSSSSAGASSSSSSPEE